MINWHLEKRKISELKEYSKNPRKLSKEQANHLKTSIEKFGIIDKPFINLDNTIIGGHQRLRLLKKMSIKEIEVYVPDRSLDEKEVEELNIRHNKNQGEWDWDILANEWEIPELISYGFEPDEMLGIVQDLGTNEEPEKDMKDKKKTTCPSCGHEF